MKLSFGITTNCKTPDITNMSIKSIHNTMTSSAISDNIVTYDIIAVGRHSKLKGLTEAFDNFDGADDGFLGRIRNQIIDCTTGDIIVYLDDDILLPQDWCENFLRYGERCGVLGNRILNCDGSRYWDRATYDPHLIVDYDHPLDDPKLYQTSGFMLTTREVAKQHRWNESIHFRQHEDLEYSQRIAKFGNPLCFDKNNYVWHYDYDCIQNGNSITKKKHACNTTHPHLIPLLNRLSI